MLNVTRSLLCFLLLALVACGLQTQVRAPTPLSLPATEAIYANPQRIKSSQLAFKELVNDCPKVMASDSEHSRLQNLFSEVVKASNVKADWVTPYVLKCDEVNALSFPALRQIAVFTGLLNLGLSDDELRFVLAHEISHHLPLPKEVIDQATRLEVLMEQQYRALEQNCKHAIATVPQSQKALARDNCIKTGNVWAKSQNGQFHQSFERFVDINALQIITVMGIRGEIAKSALMKISQGEQIHPPSMAEMIATSWDRSFRSHPPAYERLQYIDWAISLVENAKSFGSLPEFYHSAE